MDHWTTMADIPNTGVGFIFGKFSESLEAERIIRIEEYSIHSLSFVSLGEQ